MYRLFLADYGMFARGAWKSYDEALTASKSIKQRNTIHRKDRNHYTQVFGPPVDL